MGILDDSLVNAKSVVKIVSKKAVEVYDVSKLRITASAIKNELNKKYMAYGKAVYDKADETVIDNLKNEITETKANLIEVIKLYNATKNSTVCNVCGEKIPGNAQFCPVCGSTADSVKNICPNCNQQVDAESFYCIHCGEKINK